MQVKFDNNGAKPPEVVLDVELSLHAGSVIPTGENREPKHYGAMTGLKLDLKEAHDNSGKFDESGRVEELWERRNAILSEWKSTRDRGGNPELAVRQKIAAWDVEDAERLRIARALNFEKLKADLESARKPEEQVAAANACPRGWIPWIRTHGEKAVLAAGPVVLRRKKYRDPLPGEKLTPDHEAILKELARQAAVNRPMTADDVKNAITEGVKAALEMVGAKK